MILLATAFSYGTFMILLAALEATLGSKTVLKGALTPRSYPMILHCQRCAQHLCCTKRPHTSHGHHLGVCINPGGHFRPQCCIFLTRHKGTLDLGTPVMNHSDPTGPTETFCSKVRRISFNDQRHAAVREASVREKGLGFRVFGEPNPPQMSCSLNSLMGVI